MHLLVGLLAAEMLAGRRLLGLIDGSRSRGHAVLHSSPGRLRLDVPGLEGRPEGPGPVLKALEAVDGIKETQYNPATGSLLLAFDPGALSAKEVLGRFDSIMHPPGEESPGGPAQQPLLSRMAAVAQTANQSVRSMTGGTVDLELLLPLTIGAVGLAKVLRQRPLELPSGWILLWWSYTSLSALHRREAGGEVP